MLAFRFLACALIFAAPAAAQTATKLSVSPSRGAGNGNSSLVELKECLSPDGSFELFVSSASNLVANDTNGFDDVFVRDTLLGTTTLASLTSAGTQVSATGTPSLSASSGYVLHATSLPGQKKGLFIYSTSADFLVYTPGSASRICVGVPRVRMTTLPTGGTAGSCNGSLSIDWLAWMSANPGAVGHPLHVGQSFYAQAWYRDALVAGTANLTRGLQFSVCP